MNQVQDPAGLDLVLLHRKHSPSLLKNHYKWLRTIWVRLAWPRKLWKALRCLAAGTSLPVSLHCQQANAAGMPMGNTRRYRRKHSLQNSIKAWKNKGCVSELLVPCPWAQNHCTSLQCKRLSTQPLQFVWCNQANGGLLAIQIQTQYTGMPAYNHLFICTVEINHNFLTLCIPFTKGQATMGLFFFSVALVVKDSSDCGSIFWHVRGQILIFILSFSPSHLLKQKLTMMLSCTAPPASTLWRRKALSQVHCVWVSDRTKIRSIALSRLDLSPFPVLQGKKWWKW